MTDPYDDDESPTLALATRTDIKGIRPTWRDGASPGGAAQLITPALATRRRRVISVARPARPGEMTPVLAAQPEHRYHTGAV